MAAMQQLNFQQIIDGVKSTRPSSPRALWNFIKVFYGLAVPTKSLCPEHASPFDYIRASFFGPMREDAGRAHISSSDLVVWACRGGGKTELGSVTTHLDSIFRPGCQTRILGGSLEQSEKMYNYLSVKWRPHFAHLLAAEPTKKRTRLANGSMVEVLTQSNRSVRGQRVHRLRCDELDEFDPDVWQAAQFVTQSSHGIGAHMEVFSTLHRPWGLMQRIVDNLAGGKASGAKLFKWCLWEVIERCPPERSCSRCTLAPDCGGRAREAARYFPIEDAIAQMRRSSTAAWRSEMLCQRPRSEDLVFSEFQPASHVSDVLYDASLPLYRAVDFGYANPFVCLHLQVRPGGSDGHEQVRVISEYVERQRTIAEHLRALRDIEPGRVECTFADPPGGPETT
ncbi:MAG: hypothetical protein QGD94_11900 [Planctomycetia bacterium]|nr:hypothetical protein [Planctomycetia bacterium]